jgi:hypothetical protein
MDADGEQSAGADRDGVRCVGALAMLVKKGDLRGHDRGSSWAQVRIGQMTLAPGTGRHQFRLGNGPQ